METGKFLFKSRLYVSYGYLSEDCHYSRACDFKGWRTGYRIFTTTDGKTYRLVLGRLYAQISFCKDVYSVKA